jgi:hypothetical protein
MQAPELLETEVVVGFVMGPLATADDEGENEGLIPAQQAAIKMMVRYLLALSKYKETGVESHKERVRAAALPYVRHLLQVIKSDGDMTGAMGSAADGDSAAMNARGELVLAASKGMIKLASDATYERMLARVPPEGSDRSAALKTYEPFMTLALVAHHENSPVRTKFVEYIVRRLARKNGKVML